MMMLRHPRRDRTESLAGKAKRVNTAQGKKRGFMN